MIKAHGVAFLSKNMNSALTTLCTYFLAIFFRAGFTVVYFSLSSTSAAVKVSNLKSWKGMLSSVTTVTVVYSVVDTSHCLTCLVNLDLN